MNGRRSVIAVAAGATVLSFSSLGASALIKSPAQVAADAAAPSPSLLTAPVERRVLRDTVVMRGTVAAERSVEVTPTASREGGELVVSGVRVRQGGSVRAGEVLAEVSGRPLIALPGAVPAYRDLRPGSRGKDVAQLQAALARLGHPCHDRAGVFGADTKRAVAAIYADLGYDPATTGEDDEQAVVAARRAVRQAERALARARSATPPAARAGKAAGSEPGTETQPDEVDAEAELAMAQADLTALERRSGAMLPVGEVVFLPGFPARVDRLNATVGDPVAAPMLVLSAGRSVVRATLPPAERSLVKVGQRVEITAEALGMTATATVTSVGQAGVARPDGDAGNGTVTKPDTTKPDTTKPDPGQAGEEPTSGPNAGLVATGIKPLDPRLIGQDVRVTVEAASSGRAVLVVPLAAVSSTADGGTQVVKVGAAGREERTSVTVGPSGDGFLEVRPASGNLVAGDRVVVGR